MIATFPDGTKQEIGFGQALTGLAIKYIELTPADLHRLHDMSRPAGIQQAVDWMIGPLAHALARYAIRQPVADHNRAFQLPRDWAKCRRTPRHFTSWAVHMLKTAGRVEFHQQDLPLVGANWKNDMEYACRCVRHAARNHNLEVWQCHEAPYFLYQHTPYAIFTTTRP